MLPEAFLTDIVAAIKAGEADDFTNTKLALCIKHGVRNIPRNIEIFMSLPQAVGESVKESLLTKPTRGLSGVAVVAIMTRPSKCPHGRCIYCPGGIGSPFGDVPQSYTGKEPATMRGIRAGFDPYVQIFSRLESYVATGHSPEKVELIVMGGTFLNEDAAYRTQFITEVYLAMNDFSTLFYKEKEIDFVRFKEYFELPGDVREQDRIQRIREKVLATKAEFAALHPTDLEEAMFQNETSRIRCVGLTIETKPDCGKLEQGNEMLRLGTTRVELGVQTVYDSVLKLVHRGHTIADTKESMRILRDLGFKINAHYMIGLPGTTKEQDIEGIKTLFTDPAFRPDMLKIYPCMLMPGTPLVELHKQGKFTPLTTEGAVDIVVAAKPFIPEYCRVMRVQRDIPSAIALASPANNMRQLVEAKMKALGTQCRCIRCREIKGDKFRPEEVLILSQQYDAGEGTEFFISATWHDKVVGFCRMRFPAWCLRDEITANAALIRELHVYGKSERLGDAGEAQHLGFGKRLLAKAESLAKQHGKDKMVVISGVGVRGYYEKQGYYHDGPYMSKQLEAQELHYKRRSRAS